jgi:cytochrome c biogenesis protein CcmG/thiol:disulfide interchange protein DsbE
MRVACTALIAVIALGPAGCGGDRPRSAAVSRAEEDAALRGAPRPLAGLHVQRNELLGGGVAAFRKRLARLRGFPIVVNKWASWCPPCRSEFPFFQRQAVARGRTVGFLGVNSLDNDAAAKRFLAEYPLSYPSYKDPDHSLAREFRGHIASPTTAFYDASGKLSYVKQGGYASERDLVRDIERYAR